ncbi:MAG: DNA repair protein RecN [Bacillota bacterium]|nr:DNA repair protein RecN [Bacillota bacterium]
MLYRLTIKNFALIDDQDITFGPGLNVLTGETGAGKSLVLDAIQAVLGWRASAGIVRAGAERAVVEGIFDLQERPGLGEDIPLEDGYLILEREVHAGGRGLYRVNGRVVPAAFYRDIGRRLVDFHGQGEQQGLLRENRHRALLDAFGGKELAPLTGKVWSLYQEWNEVRKELDEIREQGMERARRQDMLTFQVKEIDAARPRPGEDDELEQERGRLVHAARIAELADRVYVTLYRGDGRQRAAGDLIAEAIAALKELVTLDPGAGALVATLEPVLYQVQDLAHDLAPYRDLADLDPRRLEAVEDRLAVLRRLKQKYGPTLDAVLAFREQAAAELSKLAGGEERAAVLGSALRDLEQRWHEAAQALSKARAAVARRFEDSVARELRELEVGEAAFQVVFRPVEGLTAFGAEDVAFYLAPNPGEPAQPLAKAASGGELSRVMLVLKDVLAAGDEIPTMVFDEADAGVGGRALDAVAKKLAEIGHHHQVLCVTHAAQVASLARRHFQISKETVDGRTRTRITVLEGEARIEELARMLAGRKVSDLVRRHAVELLGRTGDSREGARG